MRRATAVSRMRRAAVVAGCLALPLLASFAMILGTNMIRQRYPGMTELSMLLHARQSMVVSPELQATQRKFPEAVKHGSKGRFAYNPTDRQLSIYIANHYRAGISNNEVWNSPIVQSLIQGDQRRFAEQSIADHPSPTAKESADADEAIKPFADLYQNSQSPLAMGLGMLAIYVCLPALIAAMLFRGGLALRAAGIALVRRDGRPASRLRVFWRALVAWVPFWVALVLMLLVSSFGHPQTADSLSLGMCCGSSCVLIILSLAFPQRGLPDRFAGIRPVPR